MKKKSFILYTDLKEKLAKLSIEELGYIFLAILTYVTTKEIIILPEKLIYIFDFIREDIDNNEKKYNEKVDKLRENAKKSKSKQLQPNANNCKHIESDNDNTTYTNTNTIINTNIKINKNKYSELKNVLLTEEEFLKLNDRLKNKTEAYIEKLSLYIASTGKKYKSHYATILNWYRKDNPNVPEWIDKEIKKEEVQYDEEYLRQREEIVKQIKES